MSEYHIREATEADDEGILATFNLVFGQGNPAFRPRTMAEHRWAFRENPAGTRLWVAVRDGVVAAQYAALPIRMWFDGAERRFAQIVDSFVHPDHRAGLKRPGLFVATAAPMLEHYGEEVGDLVHYGWPVWPAWRMGKTFLRYEIVRTQNLLVRPVAPDAPEDLPAGVEVLAGYDEQARWLWERCCGPWWTSAVRDDAFLNWRFRDHPRHAYTLLGVRDADGILRGTAVFRHGDWLEPGMGLCADWLVPPDEPEVAARLEAGLVALAARAGARTLTGVVPDWSHEFTWFQARGWRVHPSDYFMVGRNYDRRLDMLWLREHWWYTLADTDLV